MLAIIIGALLPIVVILLLGFFSGWHKDFTGAQATTLNRMVMLYALPLLLFGSTVTIPRSQLGREKVLASLFVPSPITTGKGANGRR